MPVVVFSVVIFRSGSSAHVDIFVRVQLSYVNNHPDEQKQRGNRHDEYGHRQSLLAVRVRRRHAIALEHEVHDACNSEGHDECDIDVVVVFVEVVIYVDLILDEEEIECHRQDVNAGEGNPEFLSIRQFHLLFNWLFWLFSL